MLLVLVNDRQRHAPLVRQLTESEVVFSVFEGVPTLQQWLEVNHEPSGLVVDCRDDRFEPFLIRFTLQYPDTPILLLTEQPQRQQELRLLGFINRLKLDRRGTGHGRILLVDDSQLVRTTFRQILESDGFAVDVACNADEGYGLAIANDYDLAVIDYQMPGRNGADLCRQLAQHEHTVELVKAVLTAQYNPKVVDDCLSAGARECLFKNESRDLFLARVRALHRSVQRRVQVDRERSRLIGLLHSVPEGGFGVTPDGRIQFVNPATTRLLGRSVVELLGRRAHAVIHPVDAGGQPTTEDLCFLQQAYLLQDELHEWRTQFVHADGSLFMVECNVTPLGPPGTREGSVVVFRDISEQQRLEQSMQWQLTHDRLTGLLNRQSFEEILERELAFLRRQRKVRQPSLLLFIDLDRFKRINDELGHAAGDQLLVTLAEQLRQKARSCDQIARLSGDEFAVFLGGVLPEAVAELAERYRCIFEQTSLDWEGQQYPISGSVGAVILDENAGTLEDMLSRADAACAQAKLRGRNQWVLHQDEETTLQQGRWHQRLHAGLSEGRFLLLQQPIWSSGNTARRVGIEHFARLREGEMLLTPSLFLSQAERYHLVAEIDEALLAQLIAHYRAQPPQGDHWLAINLGMSTLDREDFASDLRRRWESTGLAPERLCIEVSESDFLKHVRGKTILHGLRQCGFRVALDHFGLNAQSLLNLPHWPVDLIKLDPVLTSKLATDPARRHLIDAVVATARLSGVGVVACQIETGVALDLIQARDVHHVQGYYLGKPQRLSELEGQAPDS